MATWLRITIKWGFEMVEVWDFISKYIVFNSWEVKWTDVKNKIPYSSTDNPVNRVIIGKASFSVQHFEMNSTWDIVANSSEIINVRKVGIFPRWCWGDWELRCDGNSGEICSSGIIRRSHSDAATILTNDVGNIFPGNGRRFRSP